MTGRAATGGALGLRLTPCGPVIDAAAADRLRADLDGVLSPERLIAWSALAPAFAASPYLAGLARRRPERLAALLDEDPDESLGRLLAETEALDGPPEAMRAPLRRLKADLHLLTALCDLGGVWRLEAVTGALSRFADAAVQAAFRAVAAEARERGRLVAAVDDPRGPAPGLFGFAMGKHGAHELNYSSDIDLTLFHEPEVLAAALNDVEPQRFADRAAQTIASLLSERTGDGYVFRVDLRLRPDPSSTPPVVAAPRAMAYYESVGQNWERAAFIKARAVGGDGIAAEAFLKALTPFVWRRSLDYQAVFDIQSIKRQIHVHKTGEGLQAAGADLKLGRGGIREIEFFVQTQQLILGGRDPGLRSPRTLEALEALRAAGHVADDAAAELTDAYRTLRALEHRAQMILDEQTHRLPVEPAARAAVAALAGEGDLAAFDAGVEALLAGVNRRYGELFDDGDETLSSPYGSLVFTGVEDDPETLETLTRMGFADPAAVSGAIRGWHHGRIPATRTARGRELFTRLAPRLLNALAETGAPDAAFRRFSTFFAGLSAGVQVQALFLNQPRLFEMIVGVMAAAPELARTLGRYPTALHGILDARFLQPLDEDSGVEAQIRLEAAAAADFEDAMNGVRRIAREQKFRIGIHLVTGRAVGDPVSRAYTTLADACVQSLARAALEETVRQGGAMEGAVAVVALGKAGSREMTATSDLDLMTVYAASPTASSALKGWGAETFYARFTQRLIAALSAHTAEGDLYEVDMRLRPTGSKGPVSVSLTGFEAYYAGEAATWEFMALTRARVVWASDADFEARMAAAIEAALRRPRPGADLAGDVRRMRDLMMRERKPWGFWDLKLSAGGLVDAEFAAQHARLAAAARGGPLGVSTLEGLKAEPALAEAWAVQQRLSQLIACAFADRVDPETEPEAFRERLAQAGDAPDLETLKARLTTLRAAARAAFERRLPPVGDGN